jgi:hypothetical protein
MWHFTILILRFRVESNSDNRVIDSDNRYINKYPTTATMSRGGGFRGRGRGGPPGLPAFNQRDYMEAMAKAHKHGGMLYPVSPRLAHS